MAEFGGTPLNFALERVLLLSHSGLDPAVLQESFPGKARKKLTCTPPHPRRHGRWLWWAQQHVCQERSFPWYHWWWEEAFSNSLWFGMFSCSWGRSDSLWLANSFPSRWRGVSWPHSPMGEGCLRHIFGFPRWKIRFLKVLMEAQKTESAHNNTCQIELNFPFV